MKENAAVEEFAEDLIRDIPFGWRCTPKYKKMNGKITIGEFIRKRMEHHQNMEARNDTMRKLQ